MTIPLRHVKEYPDLKEDIQWRCDIMSKLIQMRNCFSLAFICAVLIHAILNFFPVQHLLHPTIYNWIHWFYGDALPTK